MLKKKNILTLLKIGKKNFEGLGSIQIECKEHWGSEAREQCSGVSRWKITKRGH